MLECSRKLVGAERTMNAGDFVLAKPAANIAVPRPTTANCLTAIELVN
jgi:hypothetical protein